MALPTPAERAKRVRLTPGRHRSPGDGACVVELASLLAGEEFSDRPDCVCPVIAAYLRAWNDRSAYAHRQRLAPYAERVVGSRSSAAVCRQRRDLSLEWVGADLSGGAISRFLVRTATRLRIAARVGIPEAFRLRDGAPEYAARTLLSRRDVAGAYLLLDAMLAIGKPGEGPADPSRPVIDGPAPFPVSSAYGAALGIPHYGRRENGNGSKGNGSGEIAPSPRELPTSSSRGD